MARLSPEKWAEVKAAYCVGKRTLEDIGAEYGVSHAAISQRAKKEGWQRLDGKLIDSAIDSRAKLTQLTKDGGLVSSHVNSEIDRLADVKAMIHEDMTEIRTLMMEVVRVKREKNELSTIDCKVAMETAAKEHEVKFGKSPDTAIQINNSVGAVEDIIDHL